MNSLLLGGNSLRNFEWLRNISDEFSDLFEISKIHKYRHWDKPEMKTNFDFELIALQQTVKDLGNYAIFAKSFGTLLALKGVADSELRPSVILFCGFPLTVINEENIPASKWLQTLKVPTIILQNDCDPLGSYDDVESFINSNDNSHIKLIRQSGDSHDYTNLSLLKSLMTEVIS